MASGIAAAVVVPIDLNELCVRLLNIRPSVVLLDLDLGEHGDGEVLVGPLTAKGVRVIAMSGTSDPVRIARALEAGAWAYCPKSGPFDALATKVRAALRGDAPLDGPLRQQLRADLKRIDSERSASQRRFERLTDREQATLQALCQGASVVAIARDWTVSEATVRSHVRGVLTKLGVPSQLAAVALAVRTGWYAPAAA